MPFILATVSTSEWASLKLAALTRVVYVSRRWRRPDAASSTDDVTGTRYRRRLHRHDDSAAGTRQHDVINDVTYRRGQSADALRIHRMYRLWTAAAGSFLFTYCSRQCCFSNNDSVLVAFHCWIPKRSFARGGALEAIVPKRIGGLAFFSASISSDILLNTFNANPPAKILFTETWVLKRGSPSPQRIKIWPMMCNILETVQDRIKVSIID